MIVSPVDELISRGADPTGYGWFGASRSNGTRKHKGWDVIVTPGQKIKSPIDGKVVRLGQAYTSTKRFKLIVIRNSIYEFKLMYLEPVPFEKGFVLKAGEYIGRAQSISSYWGKKMTDHLHIEVKKHGLLTDPEPLFIKPEWL